MEVRAIARQQRISPMKVREVTREIQGLPVSRALDLCHFTPKKAARFVGKTLKSAIANAEHNHELDVNALVVKTAVVGEGIALSRHTTRARGSGSAIKRRSSHITIILTDEIEIETRASREEKKKPTRSKKPKAGREPSKSSPGEAESPSSSEN